MRKLLGSLLVVLLAGSGCSNVIAGSPSPAGAEQRGPKGPVPAGLERFYGQPLMWGSCKSFAYDDETEEAFGEDGLDCAKLLVPLDYAKPDGKTIRLGLLRKPATDQGARIGALVLNPGGPGASGMTAAIYTADQAKSTDLRKRFDIVGFDPRGIGVSEPKIRCLTAQEMDAERLRPEPKDVATAEAQAKEFAGKCAERSGGPEVLANVGTREVARDMDILRSALGDEKLTYLGYSYGTRIGTEYAEAFPRNVRAMVLDGAVDPTQDQVAGALAQSKGFEEALERFLAWCVTEKCPVATKESLKEQFDKLELTPLAVGSRKLSVSDLGTAVAAALYTERAWEFLGQALGDLATKGDGEKLMLLADSYLGRADDGEYTSLTAANAAIGCVDDPRITDPAELADIARRVDEATKGSFMADDEPSLPARGACAFWPVPNTSTPHQPKVDGLPQVVVMSTTGDPATPYEAGVNLAKALNARLLRFEANQHTAFLSDNGCIDNAGTRYLVDLAVPAEGTRCVG